MQKVKNILSCIKFKSNGIHNHSNDLEEIFSSFQSLEIITTKGLNLSDSQAKIEGSPIKIMIVDNIIILKK